MKLHLLGFAKADDLHEFKKYKKIASFDSTSPLIKAFKDSTKNYFLRNPTGKMEYFTAIRIPQAISNNTLKNHAKSGLYKQEHLLKLEKNALDALRSYSRNKMHIEATLDAIISYSEPLHNRKGMSEEVLNRKLHNLRSKYQKTLEDRPWEKCGCKIYQRNWRKETIMFNPPIKQKTWIPTF